MKNILSFFTLSFIISFHLNAQDLTGIWRGYFITEDQEQYRFEVQMEQSKGSSLSGVTYSYQDRNFYGKSTMNGNFSKVSGNVLIQEIKTVEVKMRLGNMTCIQKCLLTYVQSGKEEFLEGTFSSVIEKTDTLMGYRRGDNCGSGKMVLRKVKTSDFYIEPFLRKRNTPTANPPLVKNNPPANNTNNSKTTTRPPAKTEIKNQPVKTEKTTVLTKPTQEAITKADVSAPVIDDEKKQIIVKPIINLPEKLKTRENSLIQTLIINSNDVTVKLYDNGEIDDDTISVYLDKKLVLSKKRLTTSALTINLAMNESDPEHELVMVAENLGRIPPNTSLMIVTAGDQRFEVRITSTEQKNAVVKFKYVKKSNPLPLP